MLALALVFGVHVWFYWPFLSDDALISFRYGQRLAEGHGLTWTGTERIEGYTDLLWVLIAAASHAVGIEPILMARVLGISAALGAMVAVGFQPLGNRLSLPRVLSGSAALALCAPLAVWAIGGLEHGFMAGLLAVVIVVLRRVWECERPPTRQLLLVGGLLTAIALLRADGMVLILATAVGLLLAKKPSWPAIRSVLILVALPAAALALQLVFRLSYYGELVPNTALVKVSFNTDRILQGLQHVRDGYTPMLPMLGLVVASVVVQLKRVPLVRWVLPLTVSVSWTAYVALVGGDIFPGWRQLLLALIPLAFTLADGAEVAWSRWAAWLTPSIYLPVLGAGLWLQTNNAENVRAKEEVWEWAGQSIGPMLGEAFVNEQPLLAVDAAGALPYWSGLPSLDMLGLNDKYIATHPPPGFGKHGIGHELGDGDYVLSREPDIIAFNNAAGARDPLLLSGRQMIHKALFRATYQLVLVQGDRGNHAFGELYVNRRKGPLAIVRTPSRADIPGYFFATAGAVATLRDGALVTMVERGKPAVLPNLSVVRGSWRLEVDPPDPALEVGFQCWQRSAIPSAAGAQPIISLSRSSMLQIALGTQSDKPIVVRRVALVLTDQEPTHRCAHGNARLELAASAVPDVAREGAAWNDATNIVFSATGLSLHFASPSRAKELALSVDNNDVYALHFLLDGERVGSAELQPKDAVVGLATHRVSVPEAAQRGGFDEVRIVPESGDGKYALGHFVAK